MAAAALLAAVIGPALLFAPLAGGIPRAADLADHLGTTIQVAEQFRNGSAYPRWMAEFHAGLGEPTLIFYPPGLYFASAACAWLLGNDVLAGFFVALALFAAAGGVGIYLLLQRRFGIASGLLASVLYAGVPYRFFELYASGLYSAFAAACLFPWVLLALSEIASERRRDGQRVSLVAWPILFAAVCLLNLPSAVLLTYFVALWLAVEVVISRTAVPIVPVALGGVLGCFLAGVYLIPAAAELPHVVVPANVRSHYESNFLFQASASWMSPDVRSLFDRMGLFPALAVLLALAVLWAALRASPRALAATPWGRLLLIAAFASFLLMTPLSGVLWKSLPVLHEVNLPWRLLEPLGVAAAALCAVSSAELLSRRSMPGVIRVAAAGILLALFVLCGVFDHSISKVNGKFPASAARAAMERFASKEGYFLPKGARRAADLAGVPALACDRPCRVRTREWSAARRRLVVEATAGTHLALRTYFFPGWSARLEGEPSSRLRTAAEPGTGRLLVDVPPGTHEITIRFGPTPPRILGAIVSALGFVGWVLFAARKPPAPRSA